MYYLLSVTMIVTSRAAQPNLVVFDPSLLLLLAELFLLNLHPLDGLHRLHLLRLHFTNNLLHRRRGQLTFSSVKRGLPIYLSTCENYTYEYRNMDYKKTSVELLAMWKDVKRLE